MTQTHMARIIPEENSNLTHQVFVNIDDLSAQTQESSPLIILRFTGCTPSVAIGTIYIDTAISIEPVASMRSILKVTPRGSYNGVFRVLKQARKDG